MRLKTCEKCNGYGNYLYDSGVLGGSLQPLRCNVCDGVGLVDADEMPFTLAKNYLKDLPKPTARAP